jgi:PAS domain S-box-containing protein
MPESSPDRFFQDLCTSAGVALIAADTAKLVRFWNEAAARMFGRTADQMLGQPVVSVVPEDRRGLADRLLSRSLSRGECSELEFRIRDEAGQTRCLAVTLSPIPSASGKSQGVSICARDVTRRMVLEQSLAESAKMESLASMAAGVAHHFNNLLGGVVTSIDFALQSDDPRLLRRTLAKASESLSRGNQLTLSLLAFAEGDRSTSPIEPVVDTVETFVEATRPTLEVQNIRIESDLSPVDAVMPANNLVTILDNLTSNAAEAMTDSGGVIRVELSTTPGGRVLILSVADNGIGIAEPDLPRVCEPFFTTKGDIRGGDVLHAGLGLAVVHGIVRDLQGSIHFSRNEPRGTICTVRLPVRKES